MKNFWRLSGIYVVGSASAFASDSVVFLKFVVEIFKPLIDGGLIVLFSCTIYYGFYLVPGSAN